jgi:hypothetical protein
VSNEHELGTLAPLTATQASPGGSMAGSGIRHLLDNLLEFAARDVSVMKRII